ncbi:AGC family protein kinase [Histomonas meleagridis]|uniref:AGC family protein kinase n=1 Tax=Histomonas meleagridis TaxID=135588 RepID=UPI003559538A|nr:AGC family protein kinase [Histomonas meleagridis]KAH0800262.1 AGC family protein kinase [Histomonas meleagridis]
MAISSQIYDIALDKKKYIRAYLEDTDPNEKDPYIREANQYMRQCTEYTYKELLENYANFTLKIGELVKKTNEKTHKFLTELLEINVVLLQLPKFYSSLAETFFNRRSSSRTSLAENLSYKETEVCRLCNQEIPVDLFEQHIKSCEIIYKSNIDTNAIQNALKSKIDEISLKFLQCEWPNEKNLAIKILLPAVHTQVILSKIIEIDVTNYDSTEYLKQLMWDIQKIPFDITFLPYIDSALEIVQQKINLSFCLKPASFVLMNTIKTGDTLKYNQVTIDDFQFIKRISSGAYARVFLAKKKVTNDIYAIKVVTKESTKFKNQVNQIMIEKDLLLKFNNPYIVKFYYSFTGIHNLYLVNEYLPGGDLYSLLQKVGSFDEETAKIYSLQILHALKYLHENGIIHRDLKPDNVLVAQDGKLKLIDFGLSHLGYSDRQNYNDTEVVGTPDYIAPEIILNKPHSYTVDYWSFGVMLYEFLLGAPPFHGKTEEKTFKNILTGEINFDEADDLSPESIDLIKKLLVPNPEKRLGAKGVDEILNHPWYHGIDLKKVEPPFKPVLSSLDDLSYFEQRYTFQNSDDQDILLDMKDDTTNAELKDFPSVSVDKIVEQNEEVAKNVQHKKNISDKEIHNLLEKQFRDDQQTGLGQFVEAVPFILKKVLRNSASFGKISRNANSFHRKSIRKSESILNSLMQWMLKKGI